MEIEQRIIEAVNRMGSFGVLESDDQMAKVAYSMQIEVNNGNIYEPYIMEIVYGCKYIEDKIGLENVLPEHLVEIYGLVKISDRLKHLPKEKNNASMAICLDGVSTVNTILEWVHMYLKGKVMVKQCSDGSLILKYQHHGVKTHSIEIGKSVSINVLCGDILMDDWDELNKVIHAIQDFPCELKYKFIHLIKYDAWVLIDISSDGPIDIKVKKKYVGLTIGAGGSNINNVKKKYKIKNKLVVKEM